MAQPKKKNDNRMGWIRLVEKTKKLKKYTIQEYEILSECRIPGVFSYKNESILCGIYSMEKDEASLFSYLCKIKHPLRPNPYNENADKKGYYFKNGAIGELIVLFSLFFRCRFYLAAIMTGELNKRGLKIKVANKFSRLKPNINLHPQVFRNDGKNFAIGLDEFLTKIIKLPQEQHQNFILASYHYHLALREIGSDTEMVFIRLVSAIEALTKNQKLTPEDDPIQSIDFDAFLDTLGLSNKEMQEIKTTLSNRKSKMRFTKFIEQYSKGYPKGGNFKAQHLRITRKKLPKEVKKIYDARSAYLHSGEPMYLSMPMRGAEKWDTDPSVGMTIGNRMFSSNQKLPYASWFEGLVRHCLLNYLDTHSK